MQDSKETEILVGMKASSLDMKDAQHRTREARKAFTQAESDYIAAKIRYQKLEESLRVHRNSTPKYEVSPRDEAIDDFRRDYPEVCKLAKERDQNRK